MGMMIELPSRAFFILLCVGLLLGAGRTPSSCGEMVFGGRPRPMTMLVSKDPLAFDLSQKTCALFFAPHTAALGPVGFGRDIDDDMVRWNTCPGGTMVACKKVPTADGDTVITGLPKPGSAGSDRDPYPLPITWSGSHIVGPLGGGTGWAQGLRGRKTLL